jgi:tetratricopeptide (TPR) repeat protein
VRSLALAAALWIAAGPAAAADAWYQSYEKGLRAIAARQWDEAERHLKAAVAAGPRSGRQVRTYGMRFMDFIPGYHLGTVYFNQERYLQAVEELRRVEAAGLVTRGDPEHPRLTEMIEQATARQAAQAASTATPSPPSRAPSQAPSAAPREADTLLAHARERLDAGDLQGARQALEAARGKEPAHPGLAAIADGLGRREADQRARAEQEASEREAARQRLALDQDVAQLARLVTARDFQAARKTASSIARRDPRHPELLRLQAEMDRQLSGPLEVERAAIRAFYGGRYETAVELLAPRATDPAATPRSLFYLGCSQAAMGLLKGADGGALLARARESFSLARAGRLVVAEKEKKLISPRIRRLFETG